MTPLQQRDLARQRRRVEIHEQTRRRLRMALSELVPGSEVIVFGSLAKPGLFNDRSDVDLAVTRLPSNLDACKLAAELMDRLERPVDVVDLGKCRFREKILREGEVWTI